MSWIKFYISKRGSSLFICFILLVCSLFFLLLMVFENLIAKNIIESQLRKLLPREYYSFYRSEHKYVNHLRELQLDRVEQGVYDGPNSLLYTKIGDGENKILIQGDSWAEQFIHSTFSKNRLKVFAKDHNTSFILAGVSSYAPSVMTAQLNLLRSRFNIKSDYIVAMVDQTDIGDELCRYKDQRTNGEFGLEIKPFDRTKYSEVYSTSDLLDDVDIYYGDNLFSSKILLLAKNQIKRKLRKKSERECTWTKITEPLYAGISIEQRAYMLNILNEYISVAFMDGNLKKLIFVTFPHKNHGLGSYKFDVYEMLQEAINLSKYKNNIINFRPSQSSINEVKANDLYLENDPGSHLTNESHSSVLTKSMLNEFLRLDLIR